MIKSFAFNDQPFSLVPQQVLQDRSLNVFSADSMTLLVGPNGSGKTKILQSLAEAVTSDGLRSALIDWENEADARTTFALYFTPIPYANNIQPNNKRFAALSPARSRGKITAEVETAINLASAFGLDAQPTLALSPYKTAFESVKRLLFYPYQAKRPSYQFRDNWIGSLARLEAEQDAQRARIGKDLRDQGVDFTDIFGTREWQAIQDNTAALEAKISRRIEDELGEDATLKIRAFDVVRKAQPFTRNVKLELLAQLGVSIIESPTKDQRKARNRFQSTLTRLCSIRNILGTTSLKNDEFRVNLQQWRDLSSIETENLAELSITRASSGSAALLDQFAKLKDAVHKISTNKSIRHLLLLIDEGDAFLHLEWQQKYIDFLDITVKQLWRERFDSIQIVLTTHSPVLMSDFPKDCIHRLRKYTPNETTVVDKRKILSFGAPLDTIIRNVGGAGTLGAFSTRVMRRILSDIESGKPIHPYQIDMIDDPVIRKHIERIIHVNVLVSRDHAD